MDKWVMEIEDFYSINHAKIEINKINVVGGVNGSGKSTVSRIFYSFLKANSIHRKDLFFKDVIKRINKLIDSLDFEDNEYDLPEYLTNDDLSQINNTLNILLEISKDYSQTASIKKEEFMKKFDSFRKILIKECEDKKIGNEFGIYRFEYYFSQDYENFLFEENNLNSDYLEDYLELKTLWMSYQKYSIDAYDECSNIYSKTMEFLNEDNPLISEKIFYQLLLKEYLSLNNYVDLKMIVNAMNKIIDIISFKTPIPYLPNSLMEEFAFDLPNYLSLGNHFSDVAKTLNILLEVSKDYDRIANYKKKELKKEILSKFDTIIKILTSKNIDVSYIESVVYSNNDDMYVDSQYLVHSIFEEYNLDFDYCDVYNELDSLIDSYNYLNINSDVYDMCVAIESVVDKFFDEDFLSVNDKTINELLINNNYFKDIDSNISFYMHSDGSNPFYCLFNNFINSVYYIDNVSIFDIHHEEMVLTNRLFHMDELISDIYEDTYTYDLNKDFKNIMEKIDKIIGGRYMQNFPYFVSNKKNDPLSFIKYRKTNLETSNTNTPSGIKQIGIVQLLLLNDKLKKDGYLIIDEPEVNLHPEWQFKFAEILVLLAKELNITIYLNSHSPMFIEAIEVLTQYYDLEDETSFYLTKKDDNDKYSFVKLDYDNLYELYDNLAKPFDIIEVYRLKNDYKRGIY